ncbi:hypothetical protein [Mucilaginibacter sp.]
MLHQITWQQYLLFAAIIMLLYYAIIWLVYFRGQFPNFFASKEKAEPVDDNLNWRNEEEYEELLGGSAEEEGVSTIESEQVHFSPKPFPAAALQQTDDEEELHGTIPDVLEDIKGIIRQSSTKSEFIDSFTSIPAKYPQIADSRHLEAINDFISEQVPFEISEEELYQLWL